MFSPAFRAILNNKNINEIDKQVNIDVSVYWPRTKPLPDYAIYDFVISWISDDGSDSFDSRNIIIDRSMCQLLPGQFPIEIVISAVPWTDIIKSHVSSSLAQLSRTECYTIILVDAVRSRARLWQSVSAISHFYIGHCDPLASNYLPFTHLKSFLTILHRA